MDDNRQKETLFEKHRENIYFRWGLTAFMVIVACVIVTQVVTKLPAFFGVLGTMARTLAPVLYGLGIAYLLDPIVGRVGRALQPWLKRRLKSQEKAESLARGIGVLVALILMLLVAWALIAMLIPQLLDSLNTLVGNLSTYYNTVSRWITDLLQREDFALVDKTQQLLDQVYDYLTDWLTSSLLPKLQSLAVNLTTGVFGMAKSLLNIVIGIIISVYLLLGKHKFLAQAKKACYGLLGVKKAGYVCNVCTFANQAFGGFIGGKIVDSLIIGVLCFIGLSILDMPYTLLISIIVGVTNIIPFFGPYIGAIPSAFLLLVVNPMDCLYFIIFILVLQQLDGNIIGPMILGDATGLSSFWVVVAILLFGSLYGVLGMIIGVPLFAVLYKIITEIINWLLRRKGLSTVSRDYMDWDYPPPARRGGLAAAQDGEKAEASFLEKERISGMQAAHSGAVRPGTGRAGPGGPKRPGGAASELTFPGNPQIIG